MDSIRIGDGENAANENGLGRDFCSCGARENGGPHNLACVMEQDGLRTVTITFGAGIFASDSDGSGEAVET